MLTVISCAYLPSAYLWQSVCSTHLFIFKLSWFSCCLESIYSRRKSVVRKALFCPSLHLSFHSLTGIFHRAQILLLIKFNLLTFSFYGLCFFGFMSKKSLSSSSSQRLSPMFSPKYFIVLHITFRFMI